MAIHEAIYRCRAAENMFRKVNHHPAIYVAIIFAIIPQRRSIRAAFAICFQFFQRQHAILRLDAARRHSLQPFFNFGLRRVSDKLNAWRCAFARHTLILCRKELLLGCMWKNVERHPVSAIRAFRRFTHRSFPLFPPQAA